MKSALGNRHVLLPPRHHPHNQQARDTPTSSATTENSNDKDDEDSAQVSGGIDWLSSFGSPRRPGFESLVGIGPPLPLPPASTAPPAPAKSADGLHILTEGLGFESSDETDSTTSSPRCLARLDSLHEDSNADDANGDPEDDGPAAEEDAPSMVASAANPVARFPPPLPSIGGRHGQPPVMMKATKRDGRFVLQEVKFRLPPQDVLLHAWRGDGRLKLRLVSNGGGPSVEAAASPPSPCAGRGMPGS